MFSERRGAARTPRLELEWLRAALTQEIAPLRLEVCYTFILLFPRVPIPDPTTPPIPFIPHLLPWLPACVYVCTCMHACSHVLVTGVRQASDCHPGAMPGFLQSTWLPSFVLMNGELPYQSLCLQSQVGPWSPTGLFALYLSLPLQPTSCPHTHTHIHTNRRGAELPRQMTPDWHTVATNTHSKHVLTSKSIIFISWIFPGSCTEALGNIYSCFILVLSRGKHKRNHTSLPPWLMPR